MMFIADINEKIFQIEAKKDEINIHQKLRKLIGCGVTHAPIERVNLSPDENKGGYYIDMRVFVSFRDAKDFLDISSTYDMLTLKDKDINYDS